jgi:hypothetical protein
MHTLVNIMCGIFLIFWIIFIYRKVFDLLSRVRGSVTNSNGLWIGWLDLLTLLLQSVLIAISLQQLTINLQPNPWLPRARSVLILVLRLTAHFEFHVI